MKRRTRGDEYNLIKLNRLMDKTHNNVVIPHMLDEGQTDRQSAYEFVENNTLLVSLLSALFLPYILGMMITLVLFYFYVGVSVTDFFHAYSGISQFVFWILGAYLIITVFDVWFLVRKFIKL